MADCCRSCVPVMVNSSGKSLGTALCFKKIFKAFQSMNIVVVKLINFWDGFLFFGNYHLLAKSTYDLELHNEKGQKGLCTNLDTMGKVLWCYECCLVLF